MEESISSSPSELELELPGFRFHPTEEELLGFYLKNMIFGKKLHFDIIGFLNIYLHEPWDLPGLAKIGEREWYFFVPREKKNGSGGRPNRTTETGFWKATGMDRKILSLSDPKKMIGLKKTLVFYKGRAPRGCKTDWIMNEYRLPTCPSSKDIVLCKIYRKATSKKVLEERAAMEEERKTAHSLEPSLTLPMETISFCSQCKEYSAAPMAAPHVAFKKELDVVITEEIGYEEADDQSRRSITTSLQLPPGNEKLPELEVPRFSTDWTQDSFWSPWLNNLTPYANLLNF